VDNQISKGEAFMWVYFKLALISVLSTCIPFIAQAGVFDQQYYRVLRVYKNDNDGQNQLVLNAGRNNNIIENMVFKVYRYREIYDPYMNEMENEPNPDNTRSMLVEIARARTYRVFTGLSNARIENISKASNVELLEYPAIMEGDIAVPMKMKVVKVNVMTKEIVLFDTDIFELGEGFVIRPEIKDQIIEIGKEFAGYHGGRIIIEGHTDKQGLSEVNRSTSFEKARVIKTFFMDELSMDEDGILCIGYGEDETFKRNNVSQEANLNNRIVIKYLLL